MPDRKSSFKLNDPSRLATNKAVRGENPGAFVCEKSCCASGHRSGEILIAIPEPENLQKREMSEEEIEHYEAIDTKRERERIKALKDQVMQEFEWGDMRVPDWLRKICMWGVVGLSSILLLQIVGQITNFLAQLNTLPHWSQWIIGIFLLLILGVILYLVSRLVILFFKLHKNEQINVYAIEAIKERKSLRQSAQRMGHEAVVKLKTYLEHFPLENEQKLLNMGFTLHELDELREARNKLIKNMDGEEWQRWIEQYKAGFQSLIDEIANRRVKDYALKTAIKTAISPLPILDSAIALSSSLSMVRDLMILYNLKMNSLGSVKILLHSIGQVYLAGHFQDLSVGLADFLSESITHHVGQLGAKVVKNTGSKAGEGVANGVMIYRLGKATTKLLQPIC